MVYVDFLLKTAAKNRMIRDWRISVASSKPGLRELQQGSTAKSSLSIIQRTYPLSRFRVK